MKFSLSREALLNPLQLVVGVVERRQTLPILSNVLLRLEGNQLSMTGTDLERIRCAIKKAASFDK